MSELNSSLIGYLKKKSLFSESPNKFNQIRDRSKDKKSIAEGTRSPMKANERQIRAPNSQSSRNLHQETSFRNYREDIQSEIGYQSMQVEKPTRFNNSYQAQLNNDPRTPATQRNFNFQNQNSKPVNTGKQQDYTNLWTGLVNYANSFESARIESAQCLETMFIKLQAELSSINYRIDMFQTKMLQILNKEFASAKEKIYNIVNKVFEESENNMRTYVKQQEQILAHQLLQMKQILTKQFQKVEVMKEEINKANWRKVAGELLSTELQEKVQNLLNKSRSLDIRHWEVGDLGIAKVSSLENHLRDMIKLTSR